MNQKINLIKFAFVTILALGLTSCGGKKEEDKTQEGADTIQTGIIQVDKKLFSIPSPIQAAALIKKTGAVYRKELLNSVNNVAKSSSNFKRSINLGVYGADLGYATMYEQTQDALAYLGACKKLADGLNISGAFDENLLKRFQANLSKKDSLLSLSSLAFKAGNSYLQNNERKDLASLIIAGGFVEGLHLVVNIAGETNNQEIINRIGEQKVALDNLIQLLTPYYEQEEYTEFLDQLIDLAYDFDAIETKYTYVPSETNEAAKLTVINSTTEVIITRQQLQSITEKVKNIRTQITG